MSGEIQTDNKEKFCKISGTVNQIVEGLFGTFTIYIEDGAGNKWSCSYSYSEGESRLLEGDQITVYGICEGTTTAETVLGKQVTMPDVTLKYIR